MNKRSSENISFGEWVRQQRRILDLTQQELADRIGCARITLRRIEAGTLKPLKELAQILLEKLGAPSKDEAWSGFARGVSGYPENSNDFSERKSITNLPISLTTFIGREKEQDETVNLIAKNRLVTLAGVGGIGKTRLAIQVGHRLLNEYPNGVWFVAFDSLSDPALVPQTVATVLEIREGASDQPLLERLTYALRQKTTLLIFDNCEHLLDACAQLVKTLLTDCPSLKILATSREILNLEGEATYYLGSLSTPNGNASLETLTDYESVRLFVERASLVLSSFQLTKENAHEVLGICHRVDGIPLGIELAAAHINILRTKEILKQLNESFSLLATDSRMALPRHQTMQASLAWSWGLLTATEQAFLQQLSVFAGGWTLESVQAVCKGNALSLISTLTKKSLIIVDQKTGDETRYHFHEIVRQYVRERLVESGDEERVRTRHLQYFLRLSERAETGLRSPTQVEWMSRLNDELDNIRAALEWADKTDVEAGLYLASKLYIFWDDFELREGTLWLSNFIENPDSRAHPLTRAKGLLVQGWLLHHLDQVDLLESAAQECLQLYRACNDKYGEADALGLLACTVDIAQAQDLLNHAFSLAQALKDRRRQADILAEMGWLENEYQRRKSYKQEAIEMFREFNDWRSLAENLVGLAQLTVSNGDLQAAQKWLDEARLVNQHLNNKVLRGEFLACEARMAFIRGSYETARVKLEEAATIAEESGNDLYYTWRRAELSYIILAEGNLAGAQNLFVETIQTFHKRKNEIGAAFVLEGMTKFFVAVDKPERAARLIGWADATRKRIYDTRPLLEQADVDKIIAACLAKMGEVALSDAYEEGQKMTLDEAVTFALNES